MASLFKIDFGNSGADPVASTGGAALPLAPLPDTVDVIGLQFPFPVEIIAVVACTFLTSTDTVQIIPFVGGFSQAGILQALLSGAGIAQQSVWLGTGQGIKVPAFTTISAQYKTTTAGTYTAHDIFAALVCKLPDSI